MDTNKGNKSLTSKTGTQDLAMGHIGPFGDNRVGAHAYKRTEKLVAALYMVTNLVPENEPARNAVRDKSIQILSSVLELRSGFGSAGSEHVERIVAAVCEVISLIDIIHIAGFISDMNTEILKREFHNLVFILRSAEDAGASEKITFKTDHFTVDDKGHAGGSGMSFSSVKDTGRSTKRGGVSKGRVSPRAKANGERREQILNIIKDKKKVTVKDITESITDCSSKTIQRELGTLVESGVLKKEGERRWSVYSLR